MRAIEQQLESVFTEIEQQRMRDMPMCNPNLKVEAVGFQCWGDYLLGIMITPWFMNLMLLPRSEKMVITMEQQREGSKQTQLFPSGRYEFVNAREEGLGPYQVCSLFSPLLEFDSQHVVVEIARAALDELMQSQNRDDISSHEKLIERLWYEDSAMHADMEVGTAEKSEMRLSRREFLRGRGEARRDVEHGD